MLTFLFDVATTYDPTQNKLNTTALYSPFIILLYLCNIPYYFNCSYFFLFFLFSWSSCHNYFVKPRAPYQSMRTSACRQFRVSICV